MNKTHLTADVTWFHGTTPAYHVFNVRMEKSQIVAFDVSDDCEGSEDAETYTFELQPNGVYVWDDDGNTVATLVLR